MPQSNCSYVFSIVVPLLRPLVNLPVRPVHPHVRFMYVVLAVTIPYSGLLSCVPVSLKQPVLQIDTAVSQKRLVGRLCDYGSPSIQVDPHNRAASNGPQNWQIVSDLESLFGVADPVALVTGAGAPRIGNCVARCLASRGYRIVIHANRSQTAAQETVAELHEQGAADACCVAADLTDEEAVKRVVREARDRFGRIDVLANCAAVWNPKQLEQVTASDVQRHFEANALSTFLCCQQAGLVMVAQPSGGAIVNLGDWAVARPYRDYAAYFPSKGAVVALTRSFAVELAERNPKVRVNAVLPGPVMLPPDLPPRDRQAAIQGTLVKREGRPENVADAVLFLVENDFVTGVCLPVDGGRTISSC